MSQFQVMYNQVVPEKVSNRCGRPSAFGDICAKVASGVVENALLKFDDEKVSVRARNSCMSYISRYKLPLSVRRVGNDVYVLPRAT